MKNWTLLLPVLALSAVMLSSCGPSEEEQRQAEQARQDSLEQVRQQRLQEQRQDSIARARKESMEADTAGNQEEQIDVTFDSDGAYSVQVEAWRSESKAQEQVEKWVNRGFPNAFVVKYGNEETGNIWYRVRLGRLSSRAEAEDLQQQLSNKYEASSWISGSQ